MRRWTFTDPQTAEVHTFSINPNSGGWPTLERTFTVLPTPAVDGTDLIFQGRDKPKTGQFAGTILTEDDHRETISWFDDKPYVINLTDDHGDTLPILVTNLTIVMAPTPNRPWRSTYTCDFTVMDAVGVQITQPVQTVVDAAARITSFDAVGSGSISSWRPSGPFDRDFALTVVVVASGDRYGFPADGSTAVYEDYLNLRVDVANDIVINGALETWEQTYEPAYYQGTGDGTITPAFEQALPEGDLLPVTISWEAGAFVAVQAYDWGPCTDGSCPDDGEVYGLSSGYGGLPPWVTDGTDFLVGAP